jgi:hypothetical protein
MKHASDFQVSPSAEAASDELIETVEVFANLLLRDIIPVS